MKDIRLGGKRINYLRSMEITLLVMVSTTVTVFADATDVGQNAGEWALDQIWWIALAVVGFMALKYMVKKAWVPCLVFVAIGGLILGIIQNPERLSTIGDALYNVLTQ